LTQQLDGTSSLSVNPATGNAEIASTDLNVAGVGENYTVTRYSSPDDFGYFTDPGTWATAESNTYLYVNGDGSVTYFGPDGYSAAFTKTSPTGSLIPPPGFNATLTTSGSNYVLTFNRTGTVDTFNSSGEWLTEADRNGNTITIDNTAPNWPYVPTSVTDTEGRTFLDVQREPRRGVGDFRQLRQSQRLLQL
jgi:hypothetical protein